MSVALSRARSRSRAPSTRAPLTSQPIVVDVPRSGAKSPLIIDVPAPAPRARSRSVRSMREPMVDAPGLSGGRGMFKRLIVACDGTWLNSDDGTKNGTLSIPSNITRISRAIKAVSQDGIQQIVNYHQGLGTEGGKLSRLVGGTTGKGLSDDVREAYSFLANNYHPGDEIFLLGFSRGAFTARSIGGLIGEIGLLTKKGLNTLPEVYEDVQNRRNPDYRPKHEDVPFPRKPSADDPRYAEELERRGLTRLDIPIKCIAVWDTVGSLGIPRIGKLQRLGLQMKQSKATTFYDTKLSNCVENAFQALALDENRSSFSPAVWEKPEGNRTTLRQVWFPGAHANVGGGYDDMQIANISLAWMMSQLEPFLDLRSEYLFEQDDLNEKYYKKEEGAIRPWSFGKIYSELKGAFAIGGSTVSFNSLQVHACVLTETIATQTRPIHLRRPLLRPLNRTTSPPNQRVHSPFSPHPLPSRRPWNSRPRPLRSPRPNRQLQTRRRLRCQQLSRRRRRSLLEDQMERHHGRQSPPRSPSLAPRTRTRKTRSSYLRLHKKAACHRHYAQ